MFSFLVIVTLTIISSCNVNKQATDRSGQGTTQGDLKNAQSFGYQPLDPLPVKLNVVEYKDTTKNKYVPYNRRVMNSLPDETIRLAIGEVDVNSNISFGTASIGYEKKRYVVILDYIKFETKTKSVKINKIYDKNKSVSDTITFEKINSNIGRPDAVVPVYVGVGLRLTATIEVKKGNVDLGNLFALGAAAEANKVTGTLVIQSMGISGENVSSLIPMPSEINTTTIQNAVMALASIKAKLYQEEVRVTPRIVGFYNNIGGGSATVNQFISTCLSADDDGIIHEIK